MEVYDTHNRDKKHEIEKDELPNRIGSRIRKTRLALDLKQVELGEKVGLTADRIQKYENGARKPKNEMLEKIAAAMNIEVDTLLDPSLDSDLGAVFALFELEKTRELKVKKSNGRNILEFEDGKNGPINEYLDEWIKKKAKIERKLEKASSEEERKKILNDYELWKMRFPRSCDEEKEEEEAERAKDKDKAEERLRMVREKWQIGNKNYPES